MEQRTNQPWRVVPHSGTLQAVHAPLEQHSQAVRSHRPMASGTAGRSQATTVPNPYTVPWMGATGTSSVPRVPELRRRDGAQAPGPSGTCHRGDAKDLSLRMKAAKDLSLRMKAAIWLYAPIMSG